MPAQNKKGTRNVRRRLLVIIFVILVILAGYFSWWLANGRVSSVAANLDTVVYTVEPQFSTQVENVYVSPGDLVKAGQVLARIDVADYNASLQKSARDLNHMNQMGGMQDYSSRLTSAQEAEKAMAARVAQARVEEERLRAAWQDLVTLHVRVQLAMRSMEGRNRGGYEQARQEEMAARARMESAKNEFEKFSRGRAALEQELNKIKAELLSRGGVQAVSEENPHAGVVADNDLYAPVSGRVLRVSAVPGQMVRQGQPLFLILPSPRNNETWIQAWFPLDAMGAIKPGQKANILIGKSKTEITGTVVSVADEAVFLPDSQTKATSINTLNSEDRHKYNANRYLPVRIALDYPEFAQSLEPGSKVDCQIQTRSILGFSF